MKKFQRFYKQVIVGIFCLGLLLCPVFLAEGAEREVVSGLYSMGAVLMDGDSGRILFSKNGDESAAMASTTKIMTCILALELGTPEQVVTFTDYAASMPDVQMNGKAGEQYYLKDLLYSVMLESHNDSAAAVAEAIGGTADNFLKLMNQKAEAIGCVRTHFVTPNGLDGKDSGGEHQTTAKELARILRYCIVISSKADEFLEITQTEFYEFQELQGKRYVSCRNHNALLHSYEGALTGKTGFTGKAGYCYAGAAKKDGKTMIIALLGAGWYPHKSYKWKDAGKLLDYGFAHYEYRMLGQKQWKLPKIKVLEGMEETVRVVTDAGSFPYLLKKDENVKCTVDLPKKLEAPVEKGTVVGTISYELDGTVIEQFQIRTEGSVEKASFWKKLIRWLKHFWIRNSGTVGMIFQDTFVYVHRLDERNVQKC